MIFNLNYSSAFWEEKEENECLPNLQLDWPPYIIEAQIKELTGTFVQ